MQDDQIILDVRCYAVIYICIYIYIYINKIEALPKYKIEAKTEMNEFLKLVSKILTIFWLVKKALRSLCLNRATNGDF